MEKQFLFTPSGVAEWQQELYNEGAAAVQQERTLIEGDFIVWLSDRFVLSTEQVAYAEHLGIQTLQVYAIALSNALATQTPIELEKEEKAARANERDDPYENPKVTEMKKWDATNFALSSHAVGKQDEEQSKLTFSIYYLDSV